MGKKKKMVIDCRLCAKSLELKWLAHHLALVHGDKTAMDVLRKSTDRDGEYILLIEEDDEGRTLWIMARPRRKKVEMAYVLPPADADNVLSHQFAMDAMKTWAERLAIPSALWP